MHSVNSVIPYTPTFHVWRYSAQIRSKFPALNLRFPLLFSMAVAAGYGSAIRSVRQVGARAQNCTIRVEVNRVTRMTNHSSSAECGL